MTASIGALRYQSRRGAYLRASHVGTAFANSQKNGQIAAAIA